MHATIPVLPQGVHYLMYGKGTVPPLADKIEHLAGHVLAETLAKAIELGFGFLMLGGSKAETFFENNFVMRGLDSGSGISYYQGKFLIRTRKPDDDMNVYIRFCPDPAKLFLDTPFGRRLNPMAIVEAEAINEAEADAIECNPDRMDLVIRFRDIHAILDLAQRPDADVVQLLLENLVQITGNFGHLFKFGAIGKNVQNAVMGHH